MKIVPVESKIESCTEQTLELSVLEIYLVSAAKPQLPLQIEDASRPEKNDDPNSLNIRVNQDTRLDNRVLDLRTPANQAIFRLEAGVCRLFRDILAGKGGSHHTFTTATEIFTLPSLRRQVSPKSIRRKSYRRRVRAVRMCSL